MSDRARVWEIGSAVSLGFMLVVTHAGAVEWGTPLGASYEGLEGKPRPVTPAPAELGLD